MGAWHDEPKDTAVIYFLILFQFVTHLHFVWITPIQVIAIMYLLWLQLGYSCAVSLVLMLLMIILQARFEKVYSSLRYVSHVAWGQLEQDSSNVLFHHKWELWEGGVGLLDIKCFCLSGYYNISALFYDWLQSVEMTVPLIDPLYHNTPGWVGGGGLI